MELLTDMIDDRPMSLEEVIEKWVEQMQQIAGWVKMSQLKHKVKKKKR